MNECACRIRAAVALVELVETGNLPDGFSPVLCIAAAFSLLWQALEWTYGAGR